MLTPKEEIIHEMIIKLRKALQKDDPQLRLHITKIVDELHEHLRRRAIWPL